MATHGTMAGTGTARRSGLKIKCNAFTTRRKIRIFGTVNGVTEIAVLGEKDENRFTLDKTQGEETCW